MREALEQALAALRYHRDQTRPIDRTDAAIAAAEAALAAPQEPVATAGWVLPTEDEIDEYLSEYELRGHDESGRDVGYAPTDTERGIIKDAIIGLLAEAKPAATPKAALAAPQEPVVPAGWVLVPVEATPEMIAALLGRTRFDNSWLPAYRDMLAAAPAAPARQPLSSAAVKIARTMQGTLGASRDMSGLDDDQKTLWDMCQSVIDNGAHINPEITQLIIELTTPLTDGQINQITAAQCGAYRPGAPYAAYRAYARAIERAHGIGGAA